MGDRTAAEVSSHICPPRVNTFSVIDLIVTKTDKRHIYISLASSDAHARIKEPKPKKENFIRYKLSLPSIPTSQMEIASKEQL